MGKGQKLLEVAQNYEMPESAKQLLDKNPPLILVSPSGAGKNRLAAKIAQISNYRHVITHTTRLKRPSEKQGIDYFFVDEAEMLDEAQNGEFIEIKPVHGKTFYGTSQTAYKDIIASHNRPLLIMDIQGVSEIIKRLPNIHPIFILPPSYDEWMHRLSERNFNSSEKDKRLDSARAEIRAALSNPNIIFVVNDQIGSTAHQVLSKETDPATQRFNRKLATKLLKQF